MWLYITTQAMLDNRALRLASRVEIIQDCNTCSRNDCIQCEGATELIRAVWQLPGIAEPIVSDSEEGLKLVFNGYNPILATIYSWIRRNRIPYALY